MANSSVAIKQEVDEFKAQSCCCSNDFFNLSIRIIEFLRKEFGG